MERTIKDSYRPSVIVILLDSTSHSSAVRRLPQSLKFLKEQLNLTVFDGYAKVGLNSNPNGIAFLTGRMKEPPFGKNTDAGSNDDAQQQSIWHEYKKRGFVTFFSEDDIINLTFDQFQSAPTDHFLGPFWTHMNSIQAWPHAPHRIALTYLSQLLKIYQNNPLFAVLWISSLSHDQSNDLDDSFFLDFFQKSKDLLKDSFLIFMGDHGMRFGELRSSVPGLINP
uniref:Sulfatase N-terminal domain-containing protein n=1 Tax=Plectus sambesii TaxID=2011161 RepID=A0A914XCU8_9BILA